MAEMRLMHTNLVDTATITVNSEDSILVGTNIANALRTKVFRSGIVSASPDDPSEVTIVLDLGSAQAVTSVILLDHNLTASDTGIALEGNSADSWGAPAFTQSLTRVAGPIAAYFASQSYRYWRITYTKSAGSETRDIGRVFLGTYDTAPITGLGITPMDLSKMSRAIGGQTYHDIRPVYDNIDIQMGVVIKATSDTLKTILDAVGMHTPFFISIDHDVEPVDWIYYVKMRALPRFTPVITTTYWQTSLSMSEQL